MSADIAAFAEKRDRTRAALVAFRERVRGDGDQAAVVEVDDDGASQSIPLALLRDPVASHAAVRCWGLLRAAGPLSFMSARGLAKMLGGAGGAVNAGDELFLLGWLTKEVVRDEDGSPVGTIYVLFSRRRSPAEMDALGVGWRQLVERLASSTGKDKARMAKLAVQTKSLNSLMFRIPNSEFGVRNSERNGLNLEPSESKPSPLPPSGLNEEEGASADDAGGEGVLHIGTALRAAGIPEGRLDDVRRSLLRLKSADARKAVVVELQAAATLGAARDPVGLAFHLAAQAARDGIVQPVYAPLVAQQAAATAQAKAASAAAAEAAAAAEEESTLRAARIEKRAAELIEALGEERLRLAYFSAFPGTAGLPAGVTMMSEALAGEELAGVDIDALVAAAAIEATEPA